MLVLKRKLHEDVVVRTPCGHVIRFKVVGVDRGAVRVGVTAPKAVAIGRGEIDLQKHPEVDPLELGPPPSYRPHRRQ